MTMTALYALTHQKTGMHRPSEWRLGVDPLDAALLLAAIARPVARSARGLASPRILVGACRAHADGRRVRSAATLCESTC
jgi:hypothetical protein